MSLNYQWSILWPSTLSKESLKKGVLLQLGQSSSQILISNQQPKVFYADFISEKPEVCRNTYLKVKLERDLLNKNYRIELQDHFCFLSEEYASPSSSHIHWEFSTTIKQEQKKDFSRYLMDMLVFFQERFSGKFQTISVFLEAPTFDLNDSIEFLRNSDSTRSLGFSYFPYYYEKQGFDALKTSFIWKPWARTILLADVGFDFKSEVPPGEGMIPNKSVCQIALENKNALTFLFKPETLNFEKISKMEEYLLKCDNFISTLSI